MPHRHTARLARWQVWLLGLGALGLWLTGGGWLLLHFFGQQEGDFGPEMNPLEPWMMALHGLFVIPALLAIGATFVAHIPKGWARRRQRVPGIVLCGALAVLIASGYLLYYAGGEELRFWNSTVHWTLGLALPAACAWHCLGGLAARGKARRSGSCRPEARCETMALAGGSGAPSGARVKPWESRPSR